MLEQLEDLKALAAYGREHALPAEPGEVRRLGDRRGRRRRGAIGTVVTALGAVGVAGAVTAGWVGGAGPAHEPLAHGPRSSATSTTPGTPDAETLGPDGYGALELRMSASEARATGEVRMYPSAATAACRNFALLNHPPTPGRVSGAISRRLGVAVIDGVGLHTPEGIRIGDTLADVRAAYPDAYQGGSWFSWYAPVPGHPNSRYHVLVHLDETIYQLTLEDARQDCVDWD